MASQSITTTTLPQGFSVYQSALGAQLQFFPTLGSQELDDLMNAFIPGAASLKEKRASVSLDFLEYAQLTGRNFKFYTVSPVSAAIVSSPISMGSPFNISPARFNAASENPRGPVAASVSPSPSSTQPRKSSKASSSLSHSRPTTDFSHLPGMKIMTKDGLDVTNSASRGSKTKEQRDHAHLMRIIKACDNCRRKKIRCDPSHKKRPASQAHSPKSITKPTKRARTAVQRPSAANMPALDLDAILMTQSSLLFEPTFTFADLESLEPLVGVADSLIPWDQFVQYPPLEVDSNDHLFLDLEHYISSQSPSSSSLTSDSPMKSFTPLSDPDSCLVPVADRGVFGGTETPPQPPYLDPASSLANYTDFNLFSPGSSVFLEDELMIPLSCHRQLDPAQPRSQSSNGNGPGSGLGSPANVSSNTDETSRRVLPSSDDIRAGAPPGASSFFQVSSRPARGDHLVIQDEALFANSPHDNESGRFAPESSREGGMTAPTGVIWVDAEFAHDTSHGDSARQLLLSPHGSRARSLWDAGIWPAAQTGNHLATDHHSRKTSDRSSTQCSPGVGDVLQDQAQSQTRQRLAESCLTLAHRLQETEQRALATAPHPGEIHNGIAAARMPLLESTRCPVGTMVAAPDLVSSYGHQSLSAAAAAAAVLAGETSISSTHATRSATSRSQEEVSCGTRKRSFQQPEVSTSRQHAQRMLSACATGKKSRSSEGTTKDALMSNAPQVTPLLATALIMMMLGVFARVPLIQCVAAVLFAVAVADACMRHTAISDNGCELKLTTDTGRSLITRFVSRESHTKDGVPFMRGSQNLAISRALRVAMV